MRPQLNKANGSYGIVDVGNNGEIVVRLLNATGIAPSSVHLQQKKQAHLLEQTNLNVEKVEETLKNIKLRSYF